MNRSGALNTGQPDAPPVQRLCPVCNSNQFQAYAQKKDLKLVHCGACSMVYANPVQISYASGDYYNTSGAGYYLSPAKLESDYAPVRFERELKIFRGHCRSGTVLDVGCSSGAFLYQLKQRFGDCYEVIGTDASGPALDYAESRGVKVVRGDFLEQKFAGQTFDAVTFWAVLEHVAEPKVFLEHAASLLKPGGRCFVLVPNLHSLASRILGTRYRYVYPQHLNYFTRSTLSRLASEQFSIRQACSTHFNPMVIWSDWRGGGREITDNERADLLKRTTAYKQSRLLKPIKALYRSSELLLGSLGLADNITLVLSKGEGRISAPTPAD